jgi:hypothetical protein
MKRILLFLFLVILFCFTACEPEPKCECVEKVHAGECPAPCPGKGKSPCTCIDPATLPKDQSATINDLFGVEGVDVAVEGHMTDAEWEGVADKIKTAIEADEIYEFAFTTIFNQEGATIIIEKNPPYPNYSTTVGGNKIYINFTIVNNPGALEAALQNAAAVMVGAGGQESAKVITPVPGKDAVRVAEVIVPKYNRAMQLRDNRIASRMVRQKMG